MLRRRHARRRSGSRRTGAARWSSLAGAERSRVRPVADDRRTPDGAQRPFHVDEGRAMVGIDEPAHARWIQSQTARESHCSRTYPASAATKASSAIASASARSSPQVSAPATSGKDTACPPSASGVGTHGYRYCIRNRPGRPVLQSALVRVAPDSSQKPGAVHGTRSYFGVRKPRSRAGTDRRGLRAAAWNAANWTLACPTACDWLAASCRCSSRPPRRRCSRPPAGCRVRVRGCACPRRPG